ncbi:hypothetical protein V865_002333 [Kwoniella europaea PYCC6329]|uniref:Uncharacterized protein n=1 Tax=Kwoniella europaea PYCC6329 TaxID=1423913 RepID=A0AAX4KD19_9TREE
MDLLSSSVDIAFLLLALLVVYRQPLTIPHPTAPEDVTVPPPHSPPSPHPSPGYLAVPAITVSHPSNRLNGKLPLPSAGGAGAKANGGSRHKKKTVSFSLSSMDDLKASHNESDSNSSTSSLKKFRPPTPFFKLPKSPNLQMSPISPGGKSTTPQSPSIKIEDTDAQQETEKEKERERERERELGLNRELEGVELDHGILREDTMGIQKKWLVA